MTDTPLFRAGLLDGRVVTVDEAGPFGTAAAAALRDLGARVLGPGDEQTRSDTLVLDAAGRFDAAGQEELAPLRAAVDEAWDAIRTAATQRLIAAPEGGRVVLLAPASGAGPHAEATRAAFENMARTLSIEWARYAIRITTIAPGAATRPSEVGDLVAYLVSPAGEYFSGCVFELGRS